MGLQTQEWKLGLTPMQWRVMREIVAGNDSSKAIANALGISKKTVEIHIGKAIRTLGVRTRLQAALAFERAVAGNTKED